MNIKVLASDNVIGAIQSFSLVETIPEDVVGIKLTASRMRLDKQKMKGLFSRDFVHRDAQFVPIQIVVEDGGQEMLKVHNAWFESIAVTFTTGDWIILEGMELVAESISGTIK